MMCKATITYRFKENRPQGNKNPYDSFWKFIDNYESVKSFDTPTTSTVYVKYSGNTKDLRDALINHFEQDGIKLIDGDEISIEGHNALNQLEAILYIEKDNKPTYDGSLNRFMGIMDPD